MHSEAKQRKQYSVCDLMNAQEMEDHLMARHLAAEFSAASEANLAYTLPSVALIPASASHAFSVSCMPACIESTWNTVHDQYVVLHVKHRSSPCTCVQLDI